MIPRSRDLLPVVDIDAGPVREVERLLASLDQGTDLREHLATPGLGQRGDKTDRGEAVGEPVGVDALDVPEDALVRPGEEPRPLERAFQCRSLAAGALLRSGSRISSIARCSGSASSRAFQMRASAPPGRSTRRSSREARSTSNQWKPCPTVAASTEAFASRIAPPTPS